MNEIVAGLTRAQQEAVSHIDGPLLILAGPGSGKTRVVTHRIANLLANGIAPSQIIALTFTNKAADEMRQRVQRLVPNAPVWVGTFHRFCARLLRRYASLVGLEENFTIYDSDDSLRALGESVAGSKVELSHTTPSRIAEEISRLKTALVTADQFTTAGAFARNPMLQELYPAYQRRLLSCNAVDFDDLLLHVAVLLRENPELRRTLDERYRYILVDEYQDTNFAQYAIVRALSQDFPNLAVTGDPDQSIYGWRGANVKNILDFEHDYPHVRVVRLEQNYRSTQKILSVADQLISNNRQRKHKELFTENPVGKPVRLVEYQTARDEAEQIAARISEQIREGGRRPRDIAIFYRVNSLSRQLETALRSAGIPYQIVHGLEFYQRKEIKDILAYLQLINNPRNDVAFGRIINTPPRKIGKSTLANLRTHAEHKGLPLFEAARQAGLIPTLTKRAAVHVAEFVALMDRLSLHATSPLEEIMGQVVSQTGYGEWLENSNDAEDRERMANVAELLTAAREFDEHNSGDHPLEDFLEQSALVSDSDDWEIESDRVSLMTMHSAKGLEFPVVYIVAIEHGILPHERSSHDDHQLEEERRLLFVGITRSREELQLSYARRRMFRGGDSPTITSAFLLELPRGEMEVIQPQRLCAEEESEGRGGLPWETDVYDDLPEVIDEREVVDGDFEADDIHDRPRMVRSKKPLTKPIAVKVMTAADLLGGNASPGERCSPDSFRQGMLVNHPEKGLGRIVAISGAGDRRTAVVQFFSDAAQATFVLRHSQLQPVRTSAT
jgi:DNA helicase-2/ATP-dependent DNA helicase PcrA